MVAVFGEYFSVVSIWKLAEDVVQSTLIKALENWKFNGIPDNPRAWLYRVAKKPDHRYHS